MSLNYSQFVTELALLSQYDETDPNFVSNLPSCIDYATDRIVRELNLLSTVTSNSTLQTSTTSRVVSLAALSPVFNVLQDINLLTPAGVTNPDLAARVPLTIQSRAYMNQVYGTAPTQPGAVTGPPQCFALITDQTIMVAPYPDAVYNLEIVGTVRPTPLSVANPTNWIGTYLPDLYLAAAMIQMSAFKMNFGAMSDDPKMAISWSDQYTTLRDSASVEDAMRKYMSTGWTSQLPDQFNEKRT
jgi:hypothetical protein